MAEIDVPRTMVVSSNPMRDDIANGIMMRSLFAGWPSDRLSQIYFPVATNQMPQFDVCQDYHMLRTSGLVARYDGRQPDACQPTSRGAAARRLVYRLRNRPHVQRYLKLGQELWYAHSWLGQVFERLLKRARPDVVYFLAGHYCLTRVVCRACQRLQIPVFMHVTDDFVTAQYATLPFAKQMQHVSRAWFQRLADYAGGRAAVSPTMADAYAQSYGDHWNWYTTLVDDQPVSAPAAPGDCIRLVYAGNLGLKRWQTLRDLGLELQRLRVEERLNATLDVYSSTEQREVYRQALNLPTINLKAWVPVQELPQVFASSDILVHVESDDAQMTALTRYSFSTKLSQYMMAQRCILAVGPAELASMQAVRQAGAGLIIENLQEASPRRALATLLRDPKQRNDYGDQGHRWAQEWCSSKRRREFRADLWQAIAQRMPARRAAA